MNNDVPKKRKWPVRSFLAIAPSSHELLKKYARQKKMRIREFTELIIQEYVNRLENGEKQ